MSTLPIVEHLRVDPTPSERMAVERLAERLLAERAEFAADEPFRKFMPRQIEDARTLHLDDLSKIPLVDVEGDVRFLQDRARLRAGNGDCVASCAPGVEGYESYCCDYLGLGSAEWLHPRLTAHPLRIAEACWQDRAVRRTLVRKLRSGQLRYIHPHMGTFAVWELAALLHGSSRCPIEVIAPLPAVSRWVNDKVDFAEAVSRLFGDAAIPLTQSAWNLTEAAQRVQELSAASASIGLKLPNSAGADGNLIVDAPALRGHSLQTIRESLKEMLGLIGWDGQGHLLIDEWETDVLCSPSVQTWVPPETEGLPVVEGLFVQEIEGAKGMFIGAAPARLPQSVAQEIATRCWLLARLFQLMGYIGRCSFDLVLSGPSIGTSRPVIIECNGRWGGTSLPMTLLNRIFGDWQRRPHAFYVVHVPGLDRIAFAELLAELSSDLFDVRTGKGWLILYSPGRIGFRSGISAVVLAQDWQQAAKLAQHELPARLRDLISNRPR